MPLSDSQGQSLTTPVDSALSTKVVGRGLTTNIPTANVLQITRQAQENNDLGSKLVKAGERVITPLYEAGKSVSNYLFGGDEPSTGYSASARSNTDITPAIEQPRVAPITPDSNISRLTQDVNGQQFRTYTSPQGSLAGMVPAGRGSGGFVGAGTDAEAARNQQAQSAQNIAARNIAANTDQVIERLRDLRAEKMGISRVALDTSEGRGEQEAAEDTSSPFTMPGDNFGDDTRRLNTLLSTIANPRGRSRKERESQRESALMTLELLKRAQQPARVKAGAKADPMDLQRFLLDQQKFGWQQGVDKGRLRLEEKTLEDKAATANLERQKYMDERRTNFIDNFTFSDANAPREQIAADIFEISKATGGVVPPEIVARYYEQAVKDFKIDYKKGGPKNQKELSEAVMARITQDYQEN